MGRDKALMPFSPDSDSQTLGQSAARAVAEAAGSAVLVGYPDRYRSLGYPVIPDLYPGEGPLGGILTALTHTAAEWNLVTACDMPSLTAGPLRSLLDAAIDLEADILIPENPQGGLEPLCAVYRKQALGRLDAAFRSGTRKVAEAAAGVPRLRRIPFPASQVSLFQNVNTPDEWAAHGTK